MVRSLNLSVRILIILSKYNIVLASKGQSFEITPSYNFNNQTFVYSFVEGC